MKLITMIGSVVILFTISSCGNRQENAETGQKAGPKEYPIAVLEKEDAVLQNEYPVVIRGKEDIEIRPRIDGFINAIYIDEGATVTQGEKLFEINSPQTVQSLAAARASLNSAKAQVNTAKLNVDRMKPLAEKGIVSEVQLQSYENAYKSALAAEMQANAELVNATETRKWTTVTSPVDGVVGSIPYRQGSLVNSTNVLTTVANISTVYAYFSMNEKALMELLNGLEGKNQAEKIENIPPVTLKLADGSIYPEKGKVGTISGVLDATTGTASFRAEFPNPKGILRSGISGRLSIPHTIQQVLVVPQKATFALQDKVMVYKVQGDSVVQKVISVTAMPDGKNYVVTEGLSDGDKIVTDGVATLVNGQKIKVTR
ncbi:MAG: efflux RND transporter periplasmic adaptor subunit [Bacteroidales bacterium]|jgi:membrane fusion protein (multidrug efflux system)|nr:efflux RND transporter periplasmic adaptor subunit [Bacteroidales bacterium]